MDEADRELAVRNQVPDQDASPEQRLRNQIGRAREKGRRGRNMMEELRELRAAHYKRTGADGG